jgi:hypothetical protein
LTGNPPNPYRSIGAHVSFDDKEGFGRRQLDTSPEELRAQVLWQASALDGLCKGMGTRVRYIKPHGALYHAVMAGEEFELSCCFFSLTELPLPGSFSLTERSLPEFSYWFNFLY